MSLRRISGRCSCAIKGTLSNRNAMAAVFGPGFAGLVDGIW